MSDCEITQRRYMQLRRGGRDHWDAVWLLVRWEVVNIQLLRKERGGYQCQRLNSPKSRPTS